MQAQADFTTFYDKRAPDLNKSRNSSDSFTNLKRFVDLFILIYIVDEFVTNV